MRQQRDAPYHVTIEIVNNQCKVSKMLKDSGIWQFKVVDIRGSAGTSTRHLVSMSQKQLQKLPKGTFTLQSSDKSKKEISAWFNSDGCNVCNPILSHDSFLISGRNITDNTIIYTFITPNFGAFQNIISALEHNGLKPKILKVEKYKPKGEVLTQKQEIVLWMALKTGFFDYPRKIDTAELSRKLKIGASTLSEITRRGLRRLLEHYLET